MSIDLIIFDCDGVLVDTETITARILSAYLAENGVEISPHEWERDYAGVNLAETVIRLTDTGFTPADDFVETIRARILDTLSQGVEPIPGIHHVLNQLSIPYCVASSGKPVKIQQSLRLAGLLDQFEGRMFSAYNIGVYKPEPDLFLWAADAMGVEPINTLVIEDSPVGVRAGISAGMIVAGYAGGGVTPNADANAGRADDLRALGAHYILSDLTHMMEILNARH